MLSCDTCRPQMLEYLYDLLEGEELQAMQEHLTGCAACQAELTHARAQQQLLAAAAKMTFPEVHFVPPAAPQTAAQTGGTSVPPSVAPSVVLLVRPRRRAWLRWAAAAIVLALSGAAVPAVWYERDYARLQEAVRAGEARIHDAKQKQTEAKRLLAQVPLERQDRKAAILNAQRERELQVQVRGPATVRVGAPTDYQIHTANLNGQPTDARVSVEVKDGGRPIGKPIEAVRAGPGTYRVTLPPDLPVRPNSQPTLVVSARRDNDAKAELREELQLAAPVYVTHLDLDKPMYQVGETVRFRSLTLDRFSLKPATEALRLQYVLTRPGGAQHVVAQGGNGLAVNGTVVLGPDRAPLRGIGAGEFVLEPGWGGGEFTLTVREENQRCPETGRKFLVNEYRKPILNKELDFSRKSYGPGDEVAARCKASYAGNGKPFANRPARVTVNIDGKTYGREGQEGGQPFVFSTDDKGVVIVRFTLPKAIERGQASVAVTFDDGVMPDLLVRPIPIVLKKLQVEFCPEGGDLVAGLVNRVYFQVRSTLGKPADLKGQVLEDGKPIGVAVETLASEKDPELNQGMGRFEFTPKAGRVYQLKVDSPVGVTERYPLPPVKAEGVVLSIPQGVVKANEPIPVTVRSHTSRSLMVGVYCRGRLLDSAELEKIHFTGDEAHATLRPAAPLTPPSPPLGGEGGVRGVGGVCRVTVFEVLPTGGARRHLRPVAERLIYRRPAEQVQMVLRPDSPSYVPRQKVKLGVEAVTEKDEPAAAVVLLRVVDKSVVTLADDKTLRSMPTHFLLTTEVRRPEDLEYADFLLGTHPRAAEALDLLLGTQGWRRFAEQDPVKFRQEHKEEADRLLVTIGQSQPRTTDLTEKELARVDEECDARQEQLAQQAAQAEEKAKTAGDDETYRAAVVKLGEYDDFLDRARLVGVPVLAALLVLTAFVCLILGLLRKVVRALPYYAVTAACAAAVILMVKARLDEGPPAAPPAEKQIAQASKARPEAAPANRAEAKNADRDLDFGAGHAKDKAKMAPGQGGRPPRPAPLPAMAERGFAPAAPVPQGDKNKAAMARPDFQKGEGKGGKGGGEALLKRALEDAKKQQDHAALMMQANGAGKADGLRGGMQPGAAAGFAPGMPAAMPPVPGRPMVGGRAIIEEQMRRGAKDRFGDLRAKRGEYRMPLPPMPVRVYAHGPISGDPEVRRDFTETLYWHPALVLPGGRTEVSFDLCDSVTTFEVTAFAHTLDGRLGAATKTIVSRLPFTLQPRTPLEVTAGDKIDVALAVSNNTAAQRTAHLDVAEQTNLVLESGAKSADVTVPADGSVRKLYRFRPAVQEGEAVLTFAGKADAFAADKVRTSFRVVPEGFPVIGSHSDLLEQSASHTVVLPQTWVKGTLKCAVQVYPSTLADLQKGLEGLLREPCGCFEQTSTSNYPNVLILQYLKESNQSKPPVERRAHELLDRGYRKLTSFECLSTARKLKQGYEWFGGTAPAHEALTAYGLMEFRDMARVHGVDADMVKRTQQFLLAQRDGQGGFKRNPRALDTFGRAPANITNAYIVWALTEGGKDDDVSKELDALKGQAQTSKDPYFLSLVANSLINRAKTSEAVALLRKVGSVQKDDGRLDAEQTSITGSGGRDLQIETTALAVLGWLKADPGAFHGNVNKAIQWIGRQRGGYGGFGSTQSTILALKALIAYTRANKRTAEAGALRLFVGERQVSVLPFAAGVTEPLTLTVPNAEEALKPGRNPLRVEITGKNNFPYTLSWSYQTRQPASADNCPVKLATKLDRSEARESETVRLTVRVENASGKGQGMAVAIIGLPGGLTVPEDMKQLKDYIRQPADGKRPTLSFFEIRGRELVLYWRDLAPDEKIEVPIDLICRVPGEYSGPASRAYLYYNADRKHWVEPLKVNIAAKAE